MTKLNEKVEMVLKEFKVKGEHYVTAKHLINTEKDLKEFMSNFLGQLKYDGNMALTVQAFKQYKREMNLPSLEEFQKGYEDNKKSALEGLVQEPISPAIADKFNKLYATSKEIYLDFLENKSRTVISLLKNKELGNSKPSGKPLQLF